MKVLLLEPNEATRATLSSSLRGLYGDKISIIKAIDVADALYKIKGNIFDIIISEYYIHTNSGTQRDGQQFLEELRIKRLIPGTTGFIIITSQEERKKEIEKILRTGEYNPDEYILKPITQGSIQERLKNAIDKKKLLSHVYDAMFKKDYKLAIEECKKLEKPNQIYIKDIIRLKLVCYLKLEDYSSIIELYNNTRNSNYKSIVEAGWFKFLYAKALLSLGKHEEAEQISKEVKEKYPKYMENYDLLAEILHSKGHDKEAIGVLKDAIKVSGSVERQKYLGQIALLSGDLKTAQEIIEKIIKDGEGSCIYTIDEHAKLANIYGQLENYEEALKIAGDGYEKFSKIDPSARFVTAVLESQILAKKGDLEGSKGAFKMALGEYKKNPNMNLSSNVGLYFGAECLEHGEKDLGKKMIKNGIGNGKNKYKIEKHLGKVLRGKESLSTLEKLIDNVGNEGKTTYQIAMERAKSGDIEKAISILKEQLSEELNNPINYFNVAKMLLFSMEQDIVNLACNDIEYDKRFFDAKNYIDGGEKYIGDEDTDIKKEKSMLLMMMKRLENKRQEQKRLSDNENFLSGIILK